MVNSSEPAQDFPELELGAEVYLAEPILPMGSFLRNLPQGLEREGRIKWEALAYIADALTWAYRTIHKIGLAIAQEPTAPLSDEDRSALFESVWSIVDSLDAARQIVRSAHRNPGPRTQALLQKLEVVRSLRNDMDHLAQKVPGIAVAKGFRGPIHGALSYFYVPPEMISAVGGTTVVHGGRSITIAAGSLGASELVQLVTPAARPFALPVDGFKFSAFTHAFEIGPLVARFANFIRDSSAMMEASVRQQIEAHSRAEGVPIDELLAPLPFGLVLVAEIEFVTPVVAAPSGATRP